MRFRLLSIVFVLSIAFPNDQSYASVCTAAGRKTHIADFGMKAMPISAVGISVIKEDWWGAVLFPVMHYGFFLLDEKSQNFLHKRRPCGCIGAFPSGHMRAYTVSASYLHYRYGWQYGLPGYIASFGFAYDRVRNQAHSWRDIIGTFALFNALTYVFVKKLTDDVQYLPGFSGAKKKKKPVKPKMEFIPSLAIENKTYLIGFQMKF